jgi:2-haloacid dehalogenase
MAWPISITAPCCWPSILILGKSKLNSRAVDAVILDVGNVLIDWNPRALYRKILLGAGGQPDEARIDWFMANVCTQDWNIQQDLGRSIADAERTLHRQHPEWQIEIAAYYGRFQELIPGPVETTVNCMRRLREAGIPVHGLTNFGRETFAMTRQRFDFLRDFDGVVVSGEEGLVKPDPAIFKLLIQRFKLTPSRSLFVDDSQANIDTAQALGFQVHHFTRPELLPPHLTALGLFGQ